MISLENGLVRDMLAAGGRMSFLLHKIFLVNIAVLHYVSYHKIFNSFNLKLNSRVKDAQCEKTHFCETKSAEDQDNPSKQDLSVRLLLSAPNEKKEFSMK